MGLGDGESGIEARALPGALVATGGGVVARFTDATEPALAGDYAYWLDGAGAPQLKLLAG